jgi:uncharacterized protein YjiS (DUF1127 family)
VAQRARAAVRSIRARGSLLPREHAMEKKMSAISSATRSRPPARWVRWLVTWPNRLVAHWQRRETIKTLQELNDHQLRDIGIRRDQIEAAVNGDSDPDIVRLW